MISLFRVAASLTRPNIHRILSASYALSAEQKTRLDSMVNKEKLVVFMKGTPEEPRCGFSRAVMEILRFHGVDQNKFVTYNILEDEDTRQGIKEYSNWPTIPQVYMNGEFVGGCDIMIDMHKNGELIEELQNIGIRSSLLDDPEKKV
ncbi:unnamed protein product [Owenia fusiformis]|uniref:Glutaredoxin-related protein 5, mitochondrial n=1 Tax=Owenia fusiformis TaxID=6347 RepID=A0A8J1XWC2_OWEFU|nr:unnamed protein product [Owenia fusiformis]